MKSNLSQAVLSWSAFALIGLLSAGPAAAQTYYEITDLGTLGSGSTSRAYDINNFGQITGYAMNGNPSGQRAFRWEDGVMDNLNIFKSYGCAINDAGDVAGYKSPYTYHYDAWIWKPGTGVIYIDGFSGDNRVVARGINNAAKVVGYSSQYQGNPPRAFIWQNGTTTPLGELTGGSWSYARDINNSGTTIGYAETSGGYERAVYWLPGVSEPTLIGKLPGGNGSKGFAINDQDEMVGSASSTSDYFPKHAFYYTISGGIVDLGSFGGQSSGATDINSSGMIVGYSQLPDTDYRAFIYLDGQMLDLNDWLLYGAGWRLRHALGIADDGRITGYGYHNDDIRGFLLTPTLACCLIPNGCIDVTEEDCLAISGVPQDVGSYCAQGVCPGITGVQACCFPDASCQNLWPNDCVSQGGEPQGEYSACLTTTCLLDPMPRACCLPDGTCEMLFYTECLARRGEPQGEGSDCGMAFCPELPGACCFVDQTCQDLLYADCVAQGGWFQGYGTVCGLWFCPAPEACCFSDDTCQDLPPSICLDNGGLPRGQGSECLTTDCASIIEACCLPDGSCDELNPFDCLGLGGAPMGDGSTCATVDCPQPEACCFDTVIGTGSCESLLPDDCLAAEGEPAGEGTWCLGDNDGDGRDDQCEETIPGDLDHDGDVDLDDFSIFQNNFTGPR